MSDSTPSKDSPDIKGILKKDGQPSRDVGDVSINAPVEDLSKSKNSRILNREDTKHHVLEGVEWPEGEEAPKAILSKPAPKGPKGAIKKEPSKPAASTASTPATPVTPATPPPPPPTTTTTTTTASASTAAASPSNPPTEKPRSNSDAQKKQEKKSTCTLL